jgi:hypothetical protein
MQSLVRSLRKGSQALWTDVPLFIRGAAASTSQATAAPVAAKPVVERDFLIYRWDPEQPDTPTYKTYKVDINS